jgi:hypothetical protein
MSRPKANSTANWLAVIAALLTVFLLFLIFLARILSQNGFLG